MRRRPITRRRMRRSQRRNGKKDGNRFKTKKKYDGVKSGEKDPVRSKEVTTDAPSREGRRGINKGKRSVLFRGREINEKKKSYLKKKTSAL